MPYQLMTTETSGELIRRVPSDSPVRPWHDMTPLLVSPLDLLATHLTGVVVAYLDDGCRYAVVLGDDD